MRWNRSATALILVSAWPAIAKPQELRAGANVALSYSVDADVEDCPGAGAMRAGVAAQLGYDPFEEPAALVATVQIRKAGAALQATLRLKTQVGAPRGERQLQSAAGDCAELAEAVQVALALAIDPMRLRRPALGDAEAPPTPAASVSPAVSTAVAPRAEAPVSNTPVTWSLLVGAAGAFGVAPVVTVGFPLGVEARWRDVSLEVEGRVDLPASGTFDGGSLQTELVSGGVAPCYRIRFGGLCGVLVAGVDRLTGSAFSTNAQGSSAYVAIGPRLLADLPIGGPFFGRLQFDLRIPLVYPAAVASGQQLWTTSVVEADLAAQIGLHL